MDHSLMPNPGEVVAGRYEICALVGRGGGGVVYRAQQLGIGRDVALKVLPPEHQLHAAAVRRFEREARLVSRLHHPNTVTLYEYNRTPSGLLYIVMEFVEGVPLKEVLAQHGAIPPARAVPILLQALKSLAEAHSHGIVHRDLKPANIMLCNMYGEPDFVKVLDFGVATALEVDETQFEEDVTRTADVVGTPKYMAPEQFRSQPLTPSSDLYALGCIAFEMLAGYCPFDGETLHVTIAKHLFQPAPQLPAALVEQYPVLTNVVHKLLSKKPEERFERAEEVAEVLENWDGTPGDRTIKAPTFDEVMSYAAQHGIDGDVDPSLLDGPRKDDTSPGLRDSHAGSNTITGVPDHNTPQGPQYPHSNQNNPSATPQNISLPPETSAQMGSQGSSDKQKWLLVGVIGFAAVLALVAFFVIRGQLESKDEGASAEKGDESVQADAVDPDNDEATPSPTPLVSDADLSVEQLNRATLLHFTASETVNMANTGAVEGALRPLPDGAKQATPKASNDTAKVKRPKVRSVTFKVRYMPKDADVDVRHERSARCRNGTCKIRAREGRDVAITVSADGYTTKKKTVEAADGMGTVSIFLVRRMR